MTRPGQVILVADIGGTNARFAFGRLGADGALRLCAPRGFANDDFSGPEQAVAAYLAETGARPDLAAFAVAGPVRDGAARLTNRGWRFTAHSVRAAAGAADARLVNDFAAAALALPFLDSAALTPLDGPVADWPALWRGAELRVGVLGPGTGLGHAVLTCAGGARTALDTEGGHVGFAAWDEATWAVQRAATARFGRCSIEHLLSGSGLALLYEILGGGAAAPEEVVRRDGAGDAAARRAVDMFGAILGASAGDLALATGARAMVMLGGVALALGGRLADTPFRARFEAKGGFTDYMRAIPAALAHAPYAGLIGAAASACPDAPRIGIDEDCGSPAG